MNNILSHINITHRMNEREQSMIAVAKQLLEERIMEFPFIGQTMEGALLITGTVDRYASLTLDYDSAIINKIYFGTEKDGLTKLQKNLLSYGINEANIVSASDLQHSQHTKNTLPSGIYTNIVRIRSNNDFTKPHNIMIAVNNVLQARDELKVF